MALARSFLLITLLAYCTVSQAKRNEVREVYTSDREMKTIKLAMGRSTVLSFNEKPVKVVAGNSNYFNIEFVGNDLTIQPLAQVESNLFVYTKGDTKFGFHLKVGGINQYDDMVYVRWKSNGVVTPQRQGVPIRPKKKFSPITFDLGKIQVVVFDIFPLGVTKTIIIDFIVKNKENKTIKSNQLQVFLSHSKERIKGQKLVYENEQILMHDKCKGRLFFPLKKVQNLQIYVLYKNKTRSKTLSKKYL
jgi:hypothetical protein